MSFSIYPSKTFDPCTRKALKTLSKIEQLRRGNKLILRKRTKFASEKGSGSLQGDKDVLGIPRTHLYKQK